MRASQLRNIIQAAEKLKSGDSTDYSALDPEAALEAMLQASEEKPKQQQAAPPLPKQEPLKSSHEQGSSRHLQKKGSGTGGSGCTTII